MNIITAVVLCLAAWLTSVTSVAETVGSNPFSQIFLKYGPIRSVEFRPIRNGLLCVVSSAVPVKYTVSVIENTSRNRVEVRGRAVLFSGRRPGKAIVGCTVSASYGRSYQNYTLAVWPFTPERPSGFELESGFLKYQKEYVCGKSTMKSSDYESLTRLICHDFGYLNPEKLNNQMIIKSSDSNKARRHFISCSSGANSLTDCHLTKEDHQENQPEDLLSFDYGRYSSSQRCGKVLRVECGSSKSFSSVSDSRSLKPELTILPAGQIEENDLVNIKCSAKFKFYQKQIIRLRRIRSTGVVNDLITSFTDLEISQIGGDDISLAFTFSYPATRDLMNDIFICSVHDELSLNSQSIANEVTYKMSFSEIRIKLYREVNSTSDGTAVDKSQRYLADKAVCETDSEQPMPQYEWTYVDTEGDQVVRRSKSLSLSTVEKRLPITCWAHQSLRSDSFNGSVSLSFYDNSLNNESKVRPNYKTVVQLCDETKNVSCPKDYDLVLNSLKVGYVTSCRDKLDSCYFQEGLGYYRTEKCSDAQICEVSTSIFKKLLFSALMKNVLSKKECLYGNKPYMEVTYYCLRQINDD